MALLSPGLAALLYGLSEAGVSGLGDPVVFGCLGGGALLIAAFVLHARRSQEPLLDVRLFAERGFAAANVAIFLVVAAIYGAMFLLPLYYQVLRGQTALTAGLLMAPQGIGAALMMPLGGRLTDRIGPGRVVPIGMTVVLLGTLLYTQAGPSTSYAWLAFSLFVRGLGAGWTLMPCTAGRVCPPEARGRPTRHHHAQHRHPHRWLLRHSSGGPGPATPDRHAPAQFLAAPLERRGWWNDTHPGACRVPARRRVRVRLLGRGP